MSKENKYNLFNLLVPQAPEKENKMSINYDNGSFAFPKNARIVNKKLINDKKHNCEYCGKKKCWTNKHHVTSKGASGDDVEDNLIELCGICHRKVHDGIISKEKLIKIINTRGRT